MVMGQYQQMWVHTKYICPLWYYGVIDLMILNLRENISGTIQESNDMIDAMDEASSDEEFDEEDLAEVRNG